MPGWLTNGMPVAAPLIVNGVPTSSGSSVINGVSFPWGVEGPYTQCRAAALVPVDTESANGAQPQTVAATVFQIAALSAAFSTNTATSTAGAATLNTTAGRIVTEALTTAPGATYTFVLTNSLFTTTSPAPQVAMLDGTCTAGFMTINSVQVAAGSCTIVFQNTGTTALNGTKLIVFHI